MHAQVARSVTTWKDLVQRDLMIVVCRRTRACIPCKTDQPVKRGIVSTLFYRARAITHGENQNKEEEHLTQVLRDNGYTRVS